ncbi:MAG: AEC family transporter [Clostridia bacterium]|nr:AEC family transporter [Clostridia bacterium]
MESLIFAINAVAPIIIMVAIGYILKRIGFLNDTFARMGNKLVFRALLPSMLFLNVYKIDDIGGIGFGYIGYVLVALLVIFLISVPLVIVVTKKPERRGVLLQVAFRSNYALIGIPLAQSLSGDEGVMIATLLSAVTIPLLNVLAVISLSVFREGGGKPSLKKILLEIVKNPLILGVLTGLVVLGIRSIFVQTGISFRLTDVTPVYSVLNYLSGMATPMSLLVLGAQFEFSAVASMKKEIIFGTLMRTVFVPIVGLGAAYLFFFPTYFHGGHFAAFIAMFATPVAVSSVPMAQEMNSDAILAGQLVVWTTLVSALTVFLSAFLLRLAGVFG